MNVDISQNVDLKLRRGLKVSILLVLLVACTFLKLRRGLKVLNLVNDCIVVFKLKLRRGLKVKKYTDLRNDLEAA